MLPTEFFTFASAVEIVLQII